MSEILVLEKDSRHREMPLNELFPDEGTFCPPPGFVLGTSTFKLISHGKQVVDESLSDSPLFLGVRYAAERRDDLPPGSYMATFLTPNGRFVAEAPVHKHESVVAELKTLGVTHLIPLQTAIGSNPFPYVPYSSVAETTGRSGVRGPSPSVKRSKKEKFETLPAWITDPSKRNIIAKLLRTPVSYQEIAEAAGVTKNMLVSFARHFERDRSKFAKFLQEYNPGLGE